MRTMLVAVLLSLPGCGLYVSDDAPPAVDAAPLVDAAPPDADGADAGDCCLAGCPAPGPECCTGPGDERPVCE
jgi:hypothetical protein